MISEPGKDLTKATSFRPISLLSTTAKLFEKILVSKLLLIPDYQFGFRTLHSTIEQTHRLVEAIRRASEEKKYYSTLCIDIS